MRPLPSHRWNAALCGAALALALAGCARALSPTPADTNQPPTAEFVSPADAPLSELAWTGRDDDGSVDHFRLSVVTGNAPRVRSAAQRTSAARWKPAAAVAPEMARMRRAGSGPEATVVDVEAVDDRGAISTPARRGFFQDAPAPVVRIVSPQTSWSDIPLVPSTFTITWEAGLPDGGTRVESFRYLLARVRDLPGRWQPFPWDPDVLRELYAPDFPGWQVLKPNQTTLELSGLEDREEYLFAITVFDRDGRYDPVFSASKNVFRFAVTANPPRPVLNFTSAWYSAYVPVPRFKTDPAEAVELEIPADAVFELAWFANPAPGERARTRWALDPRHPDLDETDAHDPEAGWSKWVEGPTRIALGPFRTRDGDDEHVLHVQAMGDFGYQSQELLRLRTRRYAPASRPLLVVDDTRLLPDRAVAGATAPPAGPWPTAAELDTFLFARGGVPWRGYPAGTLSPAGIFAGYDFDTIGTRDPASWSELTPEKLARYRAIVWMVDPGAAAFFGPPNDPLQPTTFLRRHALPGAVNPLATYVANGGRLWLLGGGAGSACMLPWNRGSAAVFTSPELDLAEGELVPGRFMPDLTGWRTRWISNASSAALRVTTPNVVRSGTAPPPTFPALLQAKLASTDPLPPLRQSADFHRRTSILEEIDAPTVVTAVIGDRGRELTTASVLDSLYYRIGPGGRRVLMTRMRAPGLEPVLFSGFDRWFWQRAQCHALVDAVLQGEWGLIRATGAMAARRAE